MSHPITVRGADGVLASIPALLGFHPENSLLLVCVNGPRGAVGPVARVDLLADRRFCPALVAELTALAVGHAERVILAVYADDPDDVDTDTLVASIAEHRPVLDVLRCTNGAHHVGDDLAAATVLAGRAILGCRADLAASVDHHDGTDPAAATPYLDQMGGPADRDAWIAAHLTDPDALPALIGAAQAACDDHGRTANLCATLAMLAYRHGDGALAQVAVDRAHRIDPGHRLAFLMLAVMAAGMPPTDLDALTIAM